MLKIHTMAYKNLNQSVKAILKSWYQCTLMHNKEQKNYSKT